MRIGFLLHEALDGRIVQSGSRVEPMLHIPLGEWCVFPDFGKFVKCIEFADAIFILVYEEKLVAAHIGWIHQSYIVCRENQLGVSGIDFGSVEEFHQKLHQLRMQAGVNLVDNENFPLLKRIIDMSRHP